MDQIPEEAFDDRELDRTMAIISSMTNQERSYPDILDESRFRRIARGCGRTAEDVGDLHTRFLQAREMMSSMGKMMGNPAQMQQMQQMMSGGGGFPGMGGMPGMFGGEPAPEKPSMSAADKIARRKSRRRPERHVSEIAASSFS